MSATKGDWLKGKHKSKRQSGEYSVGGTQGQTSSPSSSPTAVARNASTVAMALKITPSTTIDALMYWNECLNRTSENDPNFLTLDLEGQTYPADFVGSLAEVIKGNTHLVHLNLSRHLTGNTGVKMLCLGLRSNSSLRKLNLSYTGIGLVAAQAICDLLIINKSITQLNIAGNPLIADIGPRLAEVMKLNKTLLHLNVSECNFVAAPWRDALRWNCTLQELGASLAIPNASDLSSTSQLPSARSSGSKSSHSTNTGSSSTAQPPQSISPGPEKGANNASSSSDHNSSSVANSLTSTISQTSSPSSNLSSMPSHNHSMLALNLSGGNTSSSQSNSAFSIAMAGSGSIPIDRYMKPLTDEPNSECQLMIKTNRALGSIITYLDDSRASESFASYLRRNYPNLLVDSCKRGHQAAVHRLLELGVDPNDTTTTTAKLSPRKRMSIEIPIGGAINLQQAIQAQQTSTSGTGTMGEKSGAATTRDSGDKNFSSSSFFGTVDTSPLQEAVLHGNLHVIKLLISYGANITDEIISSLPGASASSVSILGGGKPTPTSSPTHGTLRNAGISSSSSSINAASHGQTLSREILAILRHGQNGIIDLSDGTFQLFGASSIVPRSGIIGLKLSRNALGPHFPPHLMASLLQIGAQLQILKLKGNDLTSIPSQIGDLPGLTSLSLSDNHLETIPASIGSLANLKILKLRKNPLSLIPEDIVKKGNTSKVLQYLKEITLPIHAWTRMKLLVVGKENVGKTHLIRRFQKKEYASNMSTDGLEISDVPMAKKVDFCVFDFGGQQVFYPTHMFFLSDRALFAVVFSAIDDESFRTVEYWLKVIRALAAGSSQTPVVLVATHMDDPNAGTAIPDFKERLKKLKISYRSILKETMFVSNRSGEGHKELKAKLVELASAHKILNTPVPECYVLMEKLVTKEKKENGKPLLMWAEYRSIAAKNAHIYDDSTLRACSQFLHDVGSIIWFNQPLLSELVILDPQWLSDVMASVISFKANWKSGILQHDTLPIVWKQYPSSLHKTLLGILERFEVVFPIRDSLGSSIVPTMLPDSPSEFIEAFSSLLLPPDRFQRIERTYRFGFMPLGFFSRLVSRLFIIPNLFCHDPWLKGVMICPPSAFQNSEHRLFFDRSTNNSVDFDNATDEEKSSPLASLLTKFLARTAVYRRGNIQLGDTERQLLIQQYATLSALMRGYEQASVSYYESSIASILNITVWRPLKTHNQISSSSHSFSDSPHQHVLGSNDIESITYADEDQFAVADNLMTYIVDAVEELLSSHYKKYDDSIERIMVHTAATNPAQVSEFSLTDIITRMSNGDKQILCKNNEFVDIETLAPDVCFSDIQRFSDVVVEKELGEGGVGLVYLASVPSNEIFYDSEFSSDGLHNSSSSIPSSSVSLSNSSAIPISNSDANEDSSLLAPQETSTLSSAHINTLSTSLDDLHLSSSSSHSSSIASQQPPSPGPISNLTCGMEKIEEESETDSLPNSARTSIVNLSVSAPPTSRKLIAKRKSSRGSDKGSSDGGATASCDEKMSSASSTSESIHSNPKGDNSDEEVLSEVPNEVLSEGEVDSEGKKMAVELDGSTTTSVTDPSLPKKKKVSRTRRSVSEKDKMKDKMGSGEEKEKQLKRQKTSGPKTSMNSSPVKASSSELSSTQSTATSAMPVLRRAQRSDKRGILSFTDGSSSLEELPTFDASIASSITRNTTSPSHNSRPGLIKPITKQTSSSSSPSSSGKSIITNQGRQTTTEGMMSAKKGEMGTGERTEVAVKRFKVSSGMEVQRFREFAHEVRLMASLNHPCVVRLFGVQLSPLGMIMEYISGKDLWSILHNPSISDEVFHWRIRAKLSLDIARGMRYLASQNPPIVHRDLRSPNIFILGLDETLSVSAKVADFGLSMRVLSNFSDVLQTWQWLAPEVIDMSHCNYDESSDIYSFGIVLWEIATRKFPFSEFSAYIVKDQFELTDEQLADEKLLASLLNDGWEISGKIAVRETYNRQKFVDLILKENLRPTIPSKVPTAFAKLIEMCWARDPSKRPHWNFIVSVLSKMLGDKSKRQTVAANMASGATSSSSASKNSPSLISSSSSSLSTHTTASFLSSDISSSTVESLSHLSEPHLATGSGSDQDKQILSGNSSTSSPTILSSPSTKIRSGSQNANNNQQQSSSSASNQLRKSNASDPHAPQGGAPLSTLTFLQQIQEDGGNSRQGSDAIGGGGESRGLSPSVFANLVSTPTSASSTSTSEKDLYHVEITESSSSSGMRGSTRTSEAEYSSSSSDNKGEPIISRSGEISVSPRNMGGSRNTSRVSVFGGLHSANLNVTASMPTSTKAPVILTRTIENTLSQAALVMVQAEENKIWIGQQDGRVSVFETSSPPKFVTSFVAHKKDIFAMAVVGQEMWIGSADATISVWSIKKLKLKKLLKDHEKVVRAILFVPKLGKMVLPTSKSSSGVSSESTIPSSTKSSFFGSLSSSSSHTSASSNSSVSGYVISGDTDGTVIVWKNFSLINKFRVSINQPINSLIYVDESRHLWIGTYRKIFIYSVQDWSLVTEIQAHEGMINDMVQHGDMLWTCCSNTNTLACWDTKTLENRMIIKGTPRITCLTLVSHPLDNTTLLWGGSLEKVIYIYDCNTGELIESLKGHSDYVYSMLKLHHEQSVWTSGRDCTVRTWNF